MWSPGGRKALQATHSGVLSPLELLSGVFFWEMPSPREEQHPNIGVAKGPSKSGSTGGASSMQAEGEGGFSAQEIFWEEKVWF